MENPLAKALATVLVARAWAQALVKTVVKALAETQGFAQAPQPRLTANNLDRGFWLRPEARPWPGA